MYSHWSYNAEKLITIAPSRAITASVHVYFDEYTPLNQLMSPPRLTRPYTEIPLQQQSSNHGEHDGDTTDHEGSLFIGVQRNAGALAIAAALPAGGRRGLAACDVGSRGTAVDSVLGTIALNLETRTRADATLHVLLGLRGHRRNQRGVHVPVGVRSRALDRVSRRLAGGGVGGGWVGLEGRLEVIVLIQRLDSVAFNLNDAVLVILIRVLVHETTGVDTSHFLVHQGLNLFKLARAVGDAAVLGQENGKTVVGEVLNLLVPARSLEVGVAPRVVVEGKEVGAHAVRATVHIHGRLHAVGGDIGSRIADGHLAQTLAADVVLHVTRKGLDVGSRKIRARLVVDDLVAREESESVGVASEHVDRGEDALEEHGVVRRAGVGAVERELGVRHVKDQIDAGILESLHAVIVALGVVDSVDTDGVDAQVLEVLDVTLTDAGVGKRVLVGGRTTGLVVDTTEKEAVLAGVES